MAQHIHALTASEAQVAIDHLDLLIQSLVQKRTHLEEIKAEASKEAVEREEPKVFFSYQGRGTSEKLLDHCKQMRTGSIRRIDRFIQVDPIWAVRVRVNSANPEDNYRFTDSEDSAKGVLSLHSL